MTTRSPTSAADRLRVLVRLVALFIISAAQVNGEAYYGKLIGKLSELHHGVSGEVYAVDARTLFIKDFTYDGEGPAAYFYAGTTKTPNVNGFRLRDERGSTDVLRRYRKKGITLTLPDGKTLNNVKWFSVYCDEFSVNFGDVKIPRGFDYPKPQKLAGLNGIHQVSSEPVVIVDAQTLLVPGFSYDGEAPDAKFWVGAGPHPSPQGVRVPDENGKERPLRRYDRKTIVLTLPADLTVHQIGHFGVWCEAFTVDFGHIQIPHNLNVPPSLKMLGVSPQSKLNCEVLEDGLAFEVRWAVAGDSIVVQLVAKLEDNQYMSFGVSPNIDKSSMIRGDVVAAWVDKQTLQGYADDYYLESGSQCSGGRGSCPDTRIQENTNSVRLLNAALVNGYSIVTYQRPLKASDELDHPILVNTSQAIIWAIGPLNERQEVSFHSHYLRGDRFIEFGRPPAWNCPMPDQEQTNTQGNEDRVPNTQVTTTRSKLQRQQATPAPASTKGAWVIPPIQCNEPDDGVLYAQMGPTGGKHGYPAITGHVGWGISWYINGLLIPEINVVRGMNYTFITEGGDDPNVPARYHPFYITDDPVGGYQHKTPEERAKVKIFAGVRRQGGTVRPTGVGRLCNWKPDPEQPLADDFNSFGAYQRTLTLECDAGEPGIVQWTPDENTPDTVYYQCFTHRYLGWKINVLDSCDLPEEAASETKEVYATPNARNPLSDLEGSPSVRVASKVTPTEESNQQHRHSHREYALRYPNHLSTNPSSGKLSSHTQLLTNANTHSYERLQSSSPYQEPYTLRQQPYYGSKYNVIPLHYQLRAKETRYALLDEDSSQYRQQPGLSYREKQLVKSSSASSLPTSYADRPAQSSEIEREVQPQHHHHRHHSSNQQLSNLVADSRPVSHALKIPYPLPGTQILYSRAPHNPTSYHHHHHPHQTDQQRTQLMLIRRPVLMRHPMLQTAHSMIAPAIALTPRPVFVERKKSVYRAAPPTTKYLPEKVQYVSHLAEKQPYGNVMTEKIQYNYPAAGKLMKVEPKQRTKLEAKVSEVSSVDIPEVSTGPMRPAKNTGFNPDSIVIEGGFKPIIRYDTSDSETVKNNSQEETYLSEKLKNHAINNFEPVFVPSPSVAVMSNRLKKQKKKMTLNNYSRGTKLKFDELDDMEMAADRLQSYYLPPATNVKVENAQLSSVLVTYDGKRVKDSSLARSIPQIEHHGKGKLNSELLSRTPQFGKFRGELPPTISDGRSDDVKNSKEYPQTFQGPPKDFPVLDGIAKIPKSTKLTLIQRSKRDSEGHRDMPSINFESSSYNDTHHDMYDQSKTQDSTLSSTGETIMANLGYIFLTIVLYYVL